jgi:murein L,D-transpeptidase YcbB/YkuD
MRIVGFVGPIRISVWVRVFVYAVMLGLGPFNVPAFAEDDSTSDAAPANTRVALEHMLSSAASQTTATPSNKRDIVRIQTLALYDSRNFEPVWSGDSDADGRAQIARFTLEHAADQGLRPSDYTSGFAAWKDPPKAGSDAAKYDVALTEALLRYASDVRYGRLRPREVYKDVKLLPPQAYEMVPDLEDAISHNTLEKFLASLPPPDARYQGLVAALARYRAIQAQGGWSKSGKNLAQRLAFEDPELAETPSPSDDDVRRALFRFQLRNGMKPDGKVGPEVTKALSLPVSWRVQQIIANMERWRWLPRTFEHHYIMVNVPDQGLDYMLDGQSVLHSKVVIGRKKTPTPILHTWVKAIVANPPWDVPDFIAAADLLPHLRKNSNYLASRNYVLADGPANDPHGDSVNWRGVSGNNIPYQIQQLPGPANVLGVLMMDMPNDYDVYMHDTPNKKLFDSNMRQMSNGCIRVEQILPLASLILTDDAQAGLDQINTAIATQQTQRIELESLFPTYLVYWTAIAGPEGTAGFRPDIYDRDQILIAKLGLKGTADQPAAAPARVSARPASSRSLSRK